MPNQAIQEHTIMNGVNVDQQEETIQAVKNQPELAQFQFRAHNQWKGGGHNQIHVDQYTGTGQEHQRDQPFVLTSGQPSTLLGTNEGPNPFEYLLTALSSCLTTSLVYQATTQGITIDALESDYEGDVNLEGILDLNPYVRKGYEEIRVKIKVDSNADKDLLYRLAENSPILDVIRNPTSVKIEFVTE